MNSTTSGIKPQQKDNIQSYDPPVPEYPPDDIWEHSWSEDGELISRHVGPPPEPVIKPLRYVLRDAAYALQPQPPVEWLVDGLIQTGSVNMFFGAPGSKKTYTALTIGVKVASGKPFLGRITKQVSVLVIDEDNGERRITRRIGEVLRGNGSGGETPIQSVSLAGFKLNKPSDVEELRKLIAETGAQLVIVDVLAACMDGDENKKEFVQPVFNELRKLADATGVAILILHHAGKNGDYRGSSAILGAVDLMIEVTSTDNTDIVSFKTTKTRDVASAAFSAKATWGIVDAQDAFTLDASDYKPVHKMKAGEKAVMGYFKTHETATVEQIEAAADICAPRTATNALYKLAEAGILHRTNGIERPAIYALSKPITKGPEVSKSSTEQQDVLL